MKTFKNLALAGLLTLTFVGLSLAQDGYIVRTSPAAMPSLVQQFGMRAVKDISYGRGIYLVHIPKIPGLVESLKSHPMVQSVQDNSTVSLPEVANRANVAKIPQKKSEVAQLGGPPSQDLYYSQPAVGEINLSVSAAQAGNGYGHSIRVAVIDTNMDTTNPVLQGSIDRASAKDFVHNASGYDVGVTLAQETSPFIDQETSPFIDSTGNTLLANQETSPFIDQETSPFIDQETSPFIDAAAVGHATMVAGLIHLVAPGATLIPVVAFDDTGSATVSNLIQAIQYATSLGNINVINISASMPSLDGGVATAIQNAQAAGITVVASVSNSGAGAQVYPAALDSVIGVGALDGTRPPNAPTSTPLHRASFSDYGVDVDISAPGVYVTTTFVHTVDSSGNTKMHWAMSSGTSFSTPLVTGTVAALKASGVAASTAAIVNALNSSATRITGDHAKDMGAGNLSVSGALGQ